jgi:hypothetical protein
MMKKIDVPLLELDLQERFENWLSKRGNLFEKEKSIHAQTFTIYVADEQDAFWIGCNYISLRNRLFDGPLTQTLA